MTLALLGASGSQYGWAWRSADPRVTGVFELTPSANAAAASLSASPAQPLCAPGAPVPARLMAVWQARAAWSSLAGGHTFNVSGIPAGAAAVDTYAWDGWRATTLVQPGQGWVVVAGLAGNETYVFFAHEGGSACAQWSCSFV